MSKRRNEGIAVRHARTCPAHTDGRCRCSPSYQAQIWSSRDGGRITKTFPTLAAAKSWRHDAAVALRRGTLRAAASPTLRAAAEEWLESAQAGLVRNRSGDAYKPSALRGYEQALRARVLPVLGGQRLNEVRRSDVQRLVNRMMAEGLGPSTIRNALMPLRAVYRHALTLDEVAVNPTTGVHLPAVRGRRSGLFFGRPDGRPFSNQATTQRAERGWRREGLKPIGLHDCRHTFASLMIAAGVNAKALSTFMGHASITITLDRYGHLFPGSEEEAAGLLDAYLERSIEAAGK